MEQSRPSMADARPATRLNHAGIAGRIGAGGASAWCVFARAGPGLRVGELATLRLDGRTPLPEPFKGGILALGNFDGVHLGHQAVIAHAVKLARERDVAAIVGTFDPHPVRHFRPDAAAFRLSTLDQRQRLLATHGVAAMRVFAFDRGLASVTPEAFVREWLRDVGGVVTGADFSFGRGRAGDVAMLATLGESQGLVCAAIAPVAVDGTTVSSSEIRTSLRGGDCAAAARLLSRPFTIEAVIRPGLRLDPALPLLDASVALGDYLRPRAGVYAVRARLDNGRMLSGSAYLAPEEDGALELFLVGLAARDLGRRVEVELIQSLHEARENYDPPSLRARIARDRTAGRRAVAAWIARRSDADRGRSTGSL